MERLRAASIALALMATMNGGIAYAQGVPDWGPVPTFEVIRQHTETGDRTWLRPYELDVLAPN
jgi:hypothetical protein